MLSRSFPLALFVIGLAVSSACSSEDPQKVQAPASNDTFRRRVEQATGVPWSVDIADDGTIYMEPRRPPRPIGTATTAVRSFLMRFATDLGLSRSDAEIDENEINNDNSHVVSFRQTYRGLDVEDGHVDVHVTADGIVELVVGRFVQGLGDVSTTPALDERAAIAAALADTKVHAPWFEEKHLVETAAAGLVVASRGRAPTLAYRVSVDARDAITGARIARRYLLDAQSGVILAARTVGDAAVLASGKGVHAYVFGDAADRKTFIASEDTAGYAMRWPADGEQPEIRIHDVSKTSGGKEPIVVSPSLDIWDERPGAHPGNGAAVDALFNLSQTARYFKKVFGRYSVDGKGTPLVAYVHLPNENGTWTAWSPATEHKAFLFWDVRRLGDGSVDPRLLPGSAALDVVGHEYGHALLEFMARGGGPRGNGEQGAISEGISDVLAALVEHHYAPDDRNNWTFGERATKDRTPIRNALAPETPSHVMKAVNGDSGHDDSTIVSHAFALMTLGGTHAVSRVRIPLERALGWPALERFAFKIAGYLRRQTGFGELAWLTVWTAKRKLGLPIEPVVCAWVAVGVLSHHSALTEHGVDCGCSAPGAPLDTPPVSSKDATLPCCDATMPACCRKCDDSIIGHWEGDWGKISFQEVDGELRAVYTYREGTAVVRGAGGNYTGCWSELPNRDRYDGIGPAEWTVVRNEARIDGRWRHQRETKWSNNWDVVWTSAVIPEEHKRRLQNAQAFATCR
jgi:Zn-dependent metalloprotease